MDEGDMAHALTLRQEFNLNAELATIAAQLSPSGWADLNRKTIIAAFKAIHGLDVYKAGATELRRLLSTVEGRDSLRELPQSILNATSLLRSFGICGPGSLPYAYQLVALVCAAHDISGPLSDTDGQLRKWFFWTTYNEHFTGMTSGQLKVEFERVAELSRGRQQLDWVDRPMVCPVVELRPHSVRSRVAALVMAITGDRLAGEQDTKQQELYGARGTDAMQRLFTDEPASNLANRVLADGRQLATLRAWLRGLPPELPGLGPDLDVLVRRNLLSSALIERKALLHMRATRLAEEEQTFVEELGAVWGQEEAESTTLDKGQFVPLVPAQASLQPFAGRRFATFPAAGFVLSILVLLDDPTSVVACSTKQAAEQLARIVLGEDDVDVEGPPRWRVAASDSVSLPAGKGFVLVG